MLGGSILLDKYSRHIADDIEAGGFTISASLLQRHRGRQSRRDGEDRLSDRARVHQRPPRDRSGRRGDLRRSVRAAGDRDGGGVSEQDHRAHRGRRSSPAASTRASVTPSPSSRTSISSPTTTPSAACWRWARTRTTSSTPDRSTSELAARVETRRSPTNGSTATASATTSTCTKPFLMVIQHPVTTETRQPRSTSRRRCARSARSACRRSGSGRIPTPAPARWRSASGTSASITKRRRAQMRFITNVPVDEFVAMLKATACLIGNSSAGIKECSYLGTPVVNIGARQQGRLHRRQRRPRRARGRPRFAPPSTVRCGTAATRLARLLPARREPGRSPIAWRASSSTRRSDSSTRRQPERVSLG